MLLKLRTYLQGADEFTVSQGDSNVCMHTLENCFATWIPFVNSLVAVDSQCAAKSICDCWVRQQLSVDPTCICHIVPDWSSPHRRGSSDWWNTAIWCPMIGEKKQKHKSIENLIICSLNYLSYDIWGCAYSAYPFLYDESENTCTLSYHHRQIGSMTHLPLFSVRSWSNAMRCMSLYIRMSNHYMTEIFRLWLGAARQEAITWTNCWPRSQIWHH